MPLLATLGLLTHLASPALHVEGPYFKDEAGGVVLLRGVNVSSASKTPPFLDPVNEAGFDPLVGFGANVIRLLFLWEAYEPTAGVYDSAYLESIAERIRWAEARGMGVIIDFHQDALSRYSLDGCGDGLPAWALPPSAPRAAPDNGRACAGWIRRTLFDDDLAAAWRAFFRDEGGARGRWVNMARSVAARFAGTRAVLGYDMMNEPMAEEADELVSFYTDVGQAIRSADPTAILFASPRAATSAGLASSLPALRLPRVVFAPHFYDPLMTVLGVWLGHFALSPDSMLQRARDWETPLFIGEFGAAADTWRVEAYLDAFFDWMDAGFVSGAQWSYTPRWTPEERDGWNDEDFSVWGAGASRRNWRLRAFPSRVAGLPERFWQGDGQVGLRWRHVPKLGDTVLFAPQALFGGTPRVEATGEGLTCVHDGARLTCRGARDGVVGVVLSAPP
jgi:endoglycosylceramidase